MNGNKSTISRYLISVPLIPNGHIARISIYETMDLGSVSVAISQLLTEAKKTRDFFNVLSGVSCGDGT
jgi:hypothetical protein